MLRKLLTQADGQGLVEYALILVLVAVVVVAALALLGPAVGNVFSLILEPFSPPEPPPDCYGSLLLPIMVGATGLGVAVSHLLPTKPADDPAV
jgi:pilus assembly protein Flp/PilA